MASVLVGGFFTTEPPGKPFLWLIDNKDVEFFKNLKHKDMFIYKIPYKDN